MPGYTTLTSGNAKVAKADSSTMPGYVTRSQILTDSTNRNALLALKAPLASPTFTGTPAAPTASVGTNTTQIATTAFVLANAGAGATDSIKVKASDETDTGTALQNDDDLKFGIGANQTWIGYAFLDCHAQNGTDGVGTNTCGIIFAINGPSGATLTFSLSNQYINDNYGVSVYNYYETRQTALNTNTNAPFQNTTPGIAGNSDKIVHVTFLVKSSSTTGTIQLRWYPIAGIDSDPGPTTQSATVRARSYLYARKVGSIMFLIIFIPKRRKAN
jgi:hypothetical protein